MLWPGKGHEDFNVVKMFGMVLLIIGTFIYIKLDLEDIDKDLKDQKDSIKEDSKSELDAPKY